jgi:uncharacterized protein YjbI with pentapeptide repeats
MDQLTIRETTLALPHIDEEDLQDVETIVNRFGVVSEFRLVPTADLRSLEVSGHRLTTGRISGLHVEHAKFDNLRVDSVIFADCDIPQATFLGGRWSRTCFVGCKILSGQFSEVTLEDVLFDNCKLDYSAFQGAVTKGPVIFRGCSLGEAWFSGSDLSRAVFDDCRLRETSFDRANVKGADLRGNSLSTVRGTSSLAQVTIWSSQILDLGKALVDELELHVTDE